MRTISTLFVAVGIGLGLLAAYYDCVTRSDEGEKVTLSLLLLGGGAAGAASPSRPWLWGVAVGASTPLAHLFVSIYSHADNIHPDTLLTRLSLIPICTIAAGIGAYAGAFLRGPQTQQPGAAAQ